MNTTKMLFVMIFSLFLVNCSRHDTALKSYEELLNVDSSNAINFHSMMYFPSGTALNFPGYVVAIEKSPQDVVGGPKVRKDASLLQAGNYINSEKKSWLNTKNQIERFESRDSKAMFVSHIIKNTYKPAPGPSATPYFYNNHCLVYNAYAAKSIATKAGTDLLKVNDWHSCPVSTDLGKSDINPDQFYKYGNNALDSLQKNLTQDLSSGIYTHILVIVMGWNTSQSESIRNFNDLTGNIIAASLEDADGQQEVPVNRAKASSPTPLIPSEFRPLVIGVTWPSYWSTNFRNAFSYPNKANDADEIGLSWLNKLINQTIPASMAESGQSVKFIALGHSFGARAMTRALFSSPALKPSETFPMQETPISSVNLAVAMQGAVSINRFSPSLSDEGAPYRDYAHLKHTQIVLTASSQDAALGSPFLLWTLPAGSISAYKKACTTDDYKNIFNCMTAADQSATQGGKFSLCKYGNSSCLSPFNSTATMRKIDYIDASQGITEFNSPGSGGRAHSDIYRLPMGRLLWKLIEQYAP